VVDSFTTAEGYVTLVKAAFKEKDKLSHLQKTQYSTDVIEKKQVVVTSRTRNLTHRRNLF
jgi:hypothetical protein